MAFRTPSLPSPLRLTITKPAHTLTQTSTRCIPARRLYSSSHEPLVRVTNIAAPNSGHIRILELNRAPARNAISRALLSSLQAEIRQVHAHYGKEGEIASAATGELGAPRAVVLASAVDTSFCAGADLKERRKFSPEETEQFLFDLRSTFRDIARLPIPTISAISSLALGGGLELALSTHFRVLTSNATVGLPETRLGIIPGAGGTYRLPALIGLSRARDLILTGRRVSAPEAYFLGIADRLVEVLPEEGEEGGSEEKRDKAFLARARRDALSEAVRLAQEICEGAPIAVRSALEAVGWANEDVESAMYNVVVGTEDRDEALEAFREKRKPVFKGR